MKAGDARTTGGLDRSVADRAKAGEIKIAGKGRAA
jgi:hypothetical protein